MGEVFAGRHELVDVLGRGGMGDVWRVWDLRDRAFRAAKLQRQSDSASLLRFVRESSTRVDHPHVLTPTGWWADDGRVLIVMPIADGGSVALLLADHGALGEWWARTLGLQLLDALVAVHAAGLVHRDVKPSNLLLMATGTAAPVLRLSDFGIAVRAGEPRLTHHAEVVHTPGYSAPEVRRGADPDPRQDLYSAGIVLVELLTGRRPRVDDAGGPVVVPAGLLATVIARLVAADPADRFASAAEAREALEAVSVPSPGGEPIEVFDQLPPWPPGWGPGGPVPAAPRAPVSAAPQVPGPVAPRVSVPARRVGPLPTGRGPEPASSQGPEATPSQGPEADPSQGPDAASSRRTPWPAVALAVIGVGLLVAAVVTALG